ncbi:flagellar motor protein [Corallincola luteus]|uniref:Flagellar motor protein n=2 Tax=Corallincola TaxID=1775176 RepID=A0A368N303_9GAMM|nr:MULTISPECIES: flagellar motor protein [Corallincola]RCU44550.1 flagellar motor protein [Corallincola holothuriorum]TCI05398.1 flagellar motor protein [Corallincola luteus]
MDKLTLVGFVVALVAIIGGQVWEGGSALSLLHGPAFLIVFGGTLGAVMIQTPWRQFVHSFVLLKWMILPPPEQHPRLVSQLLAWSEVARQKGFLALEDALSKESDPFTRKALIMLIDGEEPEVIRDAMDTEIILYREHMLRSAKVFESMGGYSPTIGIIGAVLGLIQAMTFLSDPNELGKGIATAFVATIYGVGFANILFLPIANKIRALVHSQVLGKEMVVEGILALAQGENPHRIEHRLLAFVPR